MEPAVLYITLFAMVFVFSANTPLETPRQAIGGALAVGVFAFLGGELTSLGFIPDMILTKSRCLIRCANRLFNCRKTLGRRHPSRVLHGASANGIPSQPR
jgi:hypothetical protein